jgi:hypothetical protein
MTRAIAGFGALALLATAGCGWYTNLPAQLDVISIEPAVVAVEYVRTKPESPLQGITAKYTQPTVTFAGQPGSIGVTFRKIGITYYRPGSGSEPGDCTATKCGDVIADINSGKELRLMEFVRVDTSAMREDYEKGYQEMDPAEFSKKRLIIGQGKAQVPIINNEVLTLAVPTKTTRPSMIYAKVIFEGEDDAKWPYTKEVNIPITFADTSF